MAKEHCVSNLLHLDLIYLSLVALFVLIQIYFTLFFVFFFLDFFLQRLKSTFNDKKNQVKLITVENIVCF